MKVKIEKIEPKQSKQGKQFWFVGDANENRYSCWDENVINQLKVGETFDIQTKTSGDFTNITGLNIEVKETNGKEDPQRQDSIEAQNALTNTVNAWVGGQVKKDEFWATLKLFYNWNSKREMPTKSNGKKEEEPAEPQEPPKNEQDNSVNIEDIPF